MRTTVQKPYGNHVILKQHQSAIQLTGLKPNVADA